MFRATRSTKRTARQAGLALTTLLALTLAACGGGTAHNGNASATAGGASDSGGTAKSSGKITLLTSTARLTDVDKSNFAEFEKQTGIKVDFQVVPDEQQTTALQTKFATNEAPDIVQYNQFSADVDFGGIEKFFTPLDNEPWVSRLVNPDALKVKDHIYLFNQENSLNLMGIVYNKEIFEKLGISIPKTFDELTAAAEKIKASGTTPFFLSVKDAWTIQMWITNGFGDYAARHEPDLWDRINANQTKWTDVPAFKTLLQQQLDLYKNGLADKNSLANTYDMKDNQILDRKTAMFVGCSCSIEALVKKDPTLKLGFFPIPHEDGSLPTISQGQGYFIPLGAKNPEGAKKLLDFLSQPEQIARTQATTMIVGNFTDSPEPQLPDYLQDVYDNYIKPGKVAMEMNSYLQVPPNDMWNYYQDAFSGGMTVDQVLSSWQKKFEELMKAANKPGF